MLTNFFRPLSAVLLVRTPTIGLILRAPTIARMGILKVKHTIESNENIAKVRQLPFTYSLKFALNIKGFQIVAVHQ